MQGDAGRCGRSTAVGPMVGPRRDFNEVDTKPSAHQRYSRAVWGSRGIFEKTTRTPLYLGVTRQGSRVLTGTQYIDWIN